MRIDIRFAKDVAISLLSACSLGSFCAMIYKKNSVPRRGIVSFEIVNGNKRICKVLGEVSRVEPYSDELAKIYLPISGYDNLDLWKEKARLMTHSDPAPETHEIVVVKTKEVDPPLRDSLRLLLREKIRQFRVQ